jgi:hypothetical protein
MPDIPTPWVGLAALLAMFVLPFVPDWLFEGPRTIRHGRAGMSAATATPPGPRGTSARLKRARPNRPCGANFAGLRRRPSSNAARGHGSRARLLRDPAPTGVPVAAGRTACATTGEREAPRRTGLARARRPCVAAPTCQCELRHSSLVHY